MRRKGRWTVLRAISNISSVAFIYRASNPSEIFFEIKDDGHPIKLVRRTLCPIGGNWIGESARGDRGPLDTVRREIREELSLERPVRTWELQAFGGESVDQFAPTPISDLQVTRDHLLSLSAVKEAINRMLMPFGTYLNTVTKEAMTRADPGNTREGYTGLSCYWLAPLDEQTWHVLVKLQSDFGNLSNESLTVMTNVHEIVERQICGAFAHERVLQRFFLAMGFQEAKRMPLTEGTASVCAGSALASYEDYLEIYDVQKRP